LEKDALGGNADADRPTFSVLQAEVWQNGSTAVIMAPGGYESCDGSGRPSSAVVVQCDGRHSFRIELGETQRAVRLVRSRTAPLGVAADRIGMMGFSAGGHLAATAATHFDDGDAGAPDPVDRVSSRPDFLILAYPVIAFDPAIAHPDSVRSLLGDNPSFELRQELSAELPVTPRTPPTLFLASRQVKVPAEMNIFENGPHGVGLDFGDPALGAGPTPVKTGLRTRGVL
jgi:dienelactone hydrolase